MKTLSRRLKEIRAAAILAVAAMLLLAAPTAAQTAQEECSCRPGWQLVTAFVLGVFVTGLVTLLATRWRSLFGRRQP